MWFCHLNGTNGGTRSGSAIRCLTVVLPAGSFRPSQNHSQFGVNSVCTPIVEEPTVRNDAHFRDKSNVNRRTVKQSQTLVLAQGLAETIDENKIPLCSKAMLCSVSSFDPGECRDVRTDGLKLARQVLPPFGRLGPDATQKDTCLVPSGVPWAVPPSAGSAPYDGHAGSVPRTELQSAVGRPHPTVREDVETSRLARPLRGRGYRPTKMLKSGRRRLTARNVRVAPNRQNRYHSPRQKRISIMTTTLTTTPASLYSRIKPASIWLEVPVLLTFNLILVASAYVSIPLPFSPVPITGQTFAVMLIGMVLGRTLGAGVVLAYLVEGACGLPVFAGGAMGLPTLIGPTGGYLMGFVIAAWVTGYLAEHKWDRNYLLSALAMLVGHVVVFAAGLSWLNLYVPGNQVIALGLMPFVIGTIIKVVAAAGVLPTVWKFAGRRDSDTH